MNTDTSPGCCANTAGVFIDRSARFASKALVHLCVLVSLVALLTPTAHATQGAAVIPPLAGVRVKATAAPVATPALFGPNFSSASPAVLSWIDYASGNAVRFRISPGYITPYPGTPEQSISRWTFIQRRHEVVDDLRNAPADFVNGMAQRHVDWSEIRSNYQGATGTDFELYLDHFDATNTDPLVLIDTTLSSLPLSATPGTADPNQATGVYWWQRWFFWRHFFIQAYYLAREHGVTNFEFVNEPDLDNTDNEIDDPKLTTDETVERMTLAADAIQRAFETVNRLRSTQGLAPLKPNLMAAGFAYAYRRHSEVIIPQRIPQDFYGYSLNTAWAFPTASGSPVRFNSYSYHAYAGNVPSNFGLHYRRVRTSLDEDTAPDVLPIYVTESNLRNGDDAEEHHWTAMTQDLRSAFR
jgi:hypothetical protein